ncbi:hypothetical protein GLOIN_2v1573959 [Rhizophagus clarus]|uniref:F-box domain-containing protein n=1 Tax=Rhizophagus clarus TaxID=94130 RepID=A0A8H3KUY4_9GLOM|nr:hypothetical protein GLOIN_2v1573959 [Rhizophagus clarus]
MVSLKFVSLYGKIPDFLNSPGAKDCLKNLSELIYGLKEIISSQNKLKELSLIFKHSNTITKFYLENSTKVNDSILLFTKFITKLTNLMELDLSEVDLYYEHRKVNLNNFKELQHAIFPQLKILRFFGKVPDIEILIKFLKKNGKNLEEFYIFEGDELLKLAIINYCPKLKTLCARFNEESLREILNSCKQLKSIRFLHKKEVMSCETHHFISSSKEIL